MNLFNLIRLTADTTTTGNAGEGAQELSGFAAFFYQYGSLLFLVLMFVIMYFVMIRPQQKRQKEEAFLVREKCRQKAEQKMRNNLRVGDELVTIGGICGRVFAIKDDTVTIETSVDRNKIVFKKSAIQTVLTKHEDPIDDDDDDDDI